MRSTKTFFSRIIPSPASERIAWNKGRMASGHSSHAIGRTMPSM